MLQQTLPNVVNSVSPSGADLDNFRSGIRPRILIVDDDTDTVTMLKLILRQAGMDVSGVANGQAALEKFNELKPDAILLDVMMPEKDGYELFRLLRQVTNVPILFLSAAPRSENLERALEIGADDFISKPFLNTELVARLKKSLRSCRDGATLSVLVFPTIELSLDLEARTASLRGQSIHLLPREFTLLNILAENAPRNVPYDKITRRMWGEDNSATRANLKTIAFALRHKLEVDPAHPCILVNNRSVGYQLITH